MRGRAKNGSKHQLLKKAWRRLRNVAVKVLLGEILSYKPQKENHGNEDYDKYIQQEETQCTVHHIRQPLISLICTTRNVPTQYFSELIESLEAQTYPYWELCIADNGSEARFLEPMRNLVTGNLKIKLCELDKNRGITLNTAAGVDFSEGEYIAFIGQSDRLPPHALCEFVKAIHQNPDKELFYSDEDKIKDTGERFDPNFKPGWSPDTLTSYNYIGHLMVVAKNLFTRVGGLRPGYDGNQEYDFALRAAKTVKAALHIPQVLYHRRESFESVAGGNIFESGRRAVEDSIRPSGTAEAGLFKNSYRARYKISGEPLVSIIIINRNSCRTLKRLLLSIEEISLYTRYELIIIDCGSDEMNIINYYRALEKENAAKVFKLSGGLNYARANNYGAKQARGRFLLFIHNDMEVLSPDWIESMMEQAQRPEIGAAGAKLLSADESVQHAGITLGMADEPKFICAGIPENQKGFSKFIVNTVRNVTAVTDACLMIEKKKFKRIGEFDEHYSSYGGDIDLCLRLLSSGYRNIYTPYAKLLHFEAETQRMNNTLAAGLDQIRKTYGEFLENGDPYYNANLDYIIHT